MKKSFLSASGARLCFLEWGTGQPIVLLHGAAGNAVWWKPLAESLDGHRVIALDMPGHGESDRLVDWDFEKTAGVVFEAISAHIPEPVILGGHSWGGKIAAIIAAHHTDYVAALLLIDPSPSRPLPIASDVFVDATFTPELGPWPSREAAIAGVKHLPQYGNWTADLDAAFLRGLIDGDDGCVEARCSRDDLIALSRAGLNVDHSATISRVSCPTLLVVADQSIPWQQPTNFQDLPHAEKVVIEGHHWIHIDKPAEVTSAVTRWLEDAGEANVK